MRGNNKVPFLSHTHLHQSVLHPWDYLVGSQHDVVCLSIIIPEMNSESEWNRDVQDECVSNLCHSLTKTRYATPYSVHPHILSVQTSGDRSDQIQWQSACGAQSAKKHIWKTQHQCLFQEIMTWLLKTIRRPCCEQFHVGTIFSLLNYTVQLYHCAEGSVHLLMDERLVFVTAQDVNINGVPLG